MIIEFELQGSKCLHKGIFDTQGFWVKYESEQEHIECSNGLMIPDPVIDGWKIYSHCSFCFYHEDKEVVDLVYSKLISVMRGALGADIEGVGHIRRLNK